MSERDTTGFLFHQTCVVIASVLAVTLYQVYMANVYCGGANKTDNPLSFNANCEALHSSVIGPSLNTVSIVVLGKIYAYVAEKLTDWGELARSKREKRGNHSTLIGHIDFYDLYR